MIPRPVFDARDKLDAAHSLLEMLKVLRFEDLHDASAQGVHATLEVVSQYVNEALDGLRISAHERPSP